MEQFTAWQTFSHQKNWYGHLCSGLESEIRVSLMPCESGLIEHHLLGYRFYIIVVRYIMASWRHDCWTWDKLVRLTCLTQQCGARNHTRGFWFFFPIPDTRVRSPDTTGRILLVFYNRDHVRDRACCRINKGIFVCVYWSDIDGAFVLSSGICASEITKSIDYPLVWLALYTQFNRHSTSPISRLLQPNKALSTAVLVHIQIPILIALDANSIILQYPPLLQIAWGYYKKEGLCDENRNISSIGWEKMCLLTKLAISDAHISLCSFSYFHGNFVHWIECSAP
jgi:hypothetical protein